MKTGLRIKRIALLMTSTVVVIGGLLYASRAYQDYRIQKIEFILFDRAHENVADLTTSDLIQYVEACGARTARVNSELHISYETIFFEKKWIVDLKEDL